MRATDWEFKNRAMLFGMIFGVSFFLFSLDHENVTTAVAAKLAPMLSMNADKIARILFALAAVLVILAAIVRTWASAYLKSAVVYAKEIKTAALVADGPYRHVRNPLYLGNVLYFLPEHATDPTRRVGGEELWVEVTLPKKGPPRPIRLGVKKDGPIEPLQLN